MEENLRKSERERSEMIAELEVARIREANLENRGFETQQQLDECHRREKETNQWIVICSFVGGAMMLLMIGIIIFMFCRRSVKASKEMKRELCARREQPGSVAIVVAEMDPRLRCSRDPQVAALRHSILTDDNEKFGMNDIEKVTEQEGIDISAVSRQSTIGIAKEGESVIQSIKKGVKGADQRKQRKQMYVEPLKEIMQKAVVVQGEVMDEIVEVMETDKAPL